MTSYDPPPPRSGEPLLLVPAAVPVFGLVFIAIHALLEFAPPVTHETLLLAFAMIPARFASNDVLELAHGAASLVTHGFVHVSWAHVLINTALLFAAAGPVFRNCGAVRLWGLFLICVAAGGIAHLAFYWGAAQPVIGGSAGSAGLIGAALRYRMRRPGDGEIIAPLDRGPVLAFTVFWVGINVALYLWDVSGLGEGSGYATIAHIAGYAAGLFLAPVMMRGIGPRRPPRHLRVIG